MNFDQPPKQEQIGKNREKLLELEKQGCYVFSRFACFRGRS